MKFILGFAKTTVEDSVDRTIFTRKNNRIMNITYDAYYVTYKMLISDFIFLNYHTHKTISSNTKTQPGSIVTNRYYL